MYNLIWFNFIMSTVLGNHMQFCHVYTYTFACNLFTIIETITFVNYLNVGFAIFIKFGEHILNTFAPNKCIKHFDKVFSDDNQCGHSNKIILLVDSHRNFISLHSFQLLARLSSTTGSFGAAKFSRGSMNGVATTGGVSSEPDIMQRQDGSHKKYVSLFSRLFIHYFGTGYF